MFPAVFCTQTKHRSKAHILPRLLARPLGYLQVRTELDGPRRERGDVVAQVGGVLGSGRARRVAVVDISSLTPDISPLPSRPLHRALPHGPYPTPHTPSWCTCAAMTAWGRRR